MYGHNATAAAVAGGAMLLPLRLSPLSDLFLREKLCNCCILCESIANDSSIQTFRNIFVFSSVRSSLWHVHINSKCWYISYCVPISIQPLISKGKHFPKTNGI